NILGGIGALGGKMSATSVLKKLVEKIPRAGLRAAVKLAGSGVSEATEEGLQTYIEAGLRKVIFDENFNLRDVSEDALYSAMLGALSAGLLESPGVVAETYAENIKKSTGNTSAKVPVENTNAPSWPSKTFEPNLAENTDVPQESGNVNTTEIKNITQDIGSSYGQNPKSTFLRDNSEDVPSSDISISENQPNVNRQNMPEGDPSVMSKDDTGVDVPAAESQQNDAEVVVSKMEKDAAERDVMMNPAGSVAQRGEVVRDENYKRANLKSREGRVLDALARITGTRIRFTETINKGKANAEYANGEITIALDSEDPVRVAVVHEVIHRLKEISADNYRKLSDFVFNNLSEEENLLLWKDFGMDHKELSPDKISEEIVAQAFGVVMGDKNRIDALIRDDRGTWEKICDVINDLIISIRRALSGKGEAQISENDRAAFSGLLSKAEEMERVLREALDNVDTKADAREEKNTAGAVKSSVKRLRDGRKYVQADRQVIFGNDPESWSEQLEDYINGKIRRGKNVELIAEDGEVLTLTADTAGKVSSMFNNDGTTMSEAAFERKVNAGSHIDELA
ncbi:MAG: hypothetical protein IJN97_02065, partial [Oscillospiraceae bacterium]|nr:hypothetical protein [Oscillospiraceae bacterium]